MEDIRQLSLFVVEGGLSRKKSLAKPLRIVAPPKIPDRKQRSSRKIENPLVWSDAVHKGAIDRGRYYANKWNLKGQDKEDFIQEAVVHIFNQCKDGRLEFIAGIETCVRRLAIDKIGRKGSRTIDAFCLDDIVTEPLTKNEVDKAFRRIVSSFPIVACVTACLESGITLDIIADAFEWDVDELRDCYEADLIDAKEQVIVSSP